MAGVPTKASFRSAPGVRSLDISTVLMSLMAPWMKVFSPQEITCLPRRTDSDWSARKRL